MKMRRIFSLLVLLPCTLVAVSQIASASTDVIYFHNGDRLTGKIKSLERGKFRFKTDATGTISIERDDIAYLNGDSVVQGAEINDNGISTSLGWDF